MLDCPTYLTTLNITHT